MASFQVQHARFIQLENKLHRRLIVSSIPVLRFAVGLVFFGFGVLKYFPGVSPAQNLAEVTFNKMSFGLVPGDVAIVGIATLECFIGLCFLAGKWMRLAVWLLALELIGILAPIVLLPARLFSGPHHAPTLEGQYVLKDVVLVAAAMVIAAGSFRGGRLVRDEPSPDLLSKDAASDAFDAARKVEIVLSATGTGRTVEQVCHERGISQTLFYEWRDAMLHGATEAVAAPRLAQKSA